MAPKLQKLRQEDLQSEASPGEEEVQQLRNAITEQEQSLLSERQGMDKRGRTCHFTCGKL